MFSIITMDTIYLNKGEIIMIVVIGRIINKSSLIGLRIFDTETKQTKDIRIEDSKKLEIKNINNIKKLGVVDNKPEDKPLLVLGYKDIRKYK